MPAYTQKYKKTHSLHWCFHFLFFAMIVKRMTTASNCHMKLHNKSLPLTVYWSVQWLAVLTVQTLGNWFWHETWAQPQNILRVWSVHLGLTTFEEHGTFGIHERDYREFSLALTVIIFQQQKGSDDFRLETCSFIGPTQPGSEKVSLLDAVKNVF